MEIIERCNLTVLQEPGQEDLADFLAEHKVIPFCAFSIHLLAAMSTSSSSMVCALSMPNSPSVSQHICMVSTGRMGTFRLAHLPISRHCVRVNREWETDTMHMQVRIVASMAMLQRKQCQRAAGSRGVPAEH